MGTFQQFFLFISKSSRIKYCEYGELTARKRVDSPLATEESDKTSLGGVGNVFLNTSLCCYALCVIREHKERTSDEVCLHHTTNGG